MKGGEGVASAQSSLEAIAFGSVAVTTRALATVGLDLTFAQWRVLVIVGEDPGGATITEIASRLGGEISPVSRLVSRLGRRGFVAVRKDARDRRATRVTVTDAGRGVREAVLEDRRRQLALVLADVGPIAPEVEVALERIGTAFRRYT
ncbi:MAG: hypothetical protein QOE66_54 [Chloroflexota bacterium]|jgi:DNA-binding MarR family transcriptional regulator|nr:hypothetical protein [Chloroflexota bacterium]